MSLIVVGYDGSTNSNAALDFAVNEAVVHGATLRIVAAWRAPVVWVDPYAVEEETERAGRRIEELVEDAFDRIRLDSRLDVQRHVEAGAAAAILLREAADADLLAVGARGRGGFPGLLLGSVAREVVNHPPCPVVVVPCVR